MREIKKQRDYEIRLVLLEAELKVLKKALKSYGGGKRITADLLHLIEAQEQKQNEKYNEEKQ